MGGIRCARCGSENAPGSRFCGVCGVRMGTVPPTEAPAEPAPAEPEVAEPEVAEPPTVVRSPGASLGSLAESLRLPVSRSGPIALVLLLDVALVAAGIWMWRASSSPPPAGPVAVAVAIDAGAPLDAAVAVIPPDAAPAGVPGRSGGVPVSTLPPPSAGGTPSVPPLIGIDAGLTLDDRIGVRDARAADAAPPPDAEPPSPLPDAEAPDAAGGPLDPYAPDDADAAPDIGDDGDDLDPAAEDAAAAVARLSSRNQSRFERCYRQAAKAYTPEQPLEGEVDISMRVMPTGDVREVAAVRNTTGSDQLARCLVTVIEGWRVAASGPDPVEVVRPFRFGARP